MNSYQKAIRKEINNRNKKSLICKENFIKQLDAEERLLLYFHKSKNKLSCQILTFNLNSFRNNTAQSKIEFSKNLKAIYLLSRI